MKGVLQTRPMKRLIRRILGYGIAIATGSFLIAWFARHNNERIHDHVQHARAAGRTAYAQKYAELEAELARLQGQSTK